MDYLAENSKENDHGFGLWLESDMIPVKANWLDAIVNDWHSGVQTPWQMGALIPDVYKHRVLKRPRKWIAAHVNGGACYNRQFAKLIPESAKKEVFDVAIYPHVLAGKGMKATSTIALSTMQRCRADIVDDRRMLLHGFMQDKDDFIDKCRQPVTQAEIQTYKNSEHYRAFTQAFERTKLMISGRGPEAMLNAMFLEIDKKEHVENCENQERHAA